MECQNNYMDKAPQTSDPLTEMLEYNKRFVAEKQYEQYATSKYPDRKIAIVTCMDTRLVQLLPAALGIKNGDVKIIKNAGGTITNPFDSTVRSLLVAIYELGVNEVMIIGHTDEAVLETVDLVKNHLRPWHTDCRMDGRTDNRYGRCRPCSVDME